MVVGDCVRLKVAPVVRTGRQRKPRGPRRGPDHAPVRGHFGVDHGPIHGWSLRVAGRHPVPVHAEIFVRDGYHGVKN